MNAMGATQRMAEMFAAALCLSVATRDEERRESNSAPCDSRTLGAAVAREIPALVWSFLKVIRSNRVGFKSLSFALFP